MNFTVIMTAYKIVKEKLVMIKLNEAQVRELINRYPYLLPRNVWTGKVVEDYDYSYILGQYELPWGWFRLFLLYCKNIRELLEKANYLNKFQFTEIKEKYGTMRLYDGGHPQDLDKITLDYEVYSGRICMKCGQPADYKAREWTECFCKNCFTRKEISPMKVKRKTHYSVTIYENEKEKKIRRSLKNIHKEYMKCLKLNDEEFVSYILS